MTRISIASINTANRIRVVDPIWADFLSEEISVDGLAEPIRVVARGNGFQLVDGARRIVACLKLGWTEIPALVEPETALPDATAVQLAEIKGHLLRGALTALDHAVSVCRWCEIYQEKNGKPKRGPKPKFAVLEGSSDEALDELSAKFGTQWSEAAQYALGVSHRGLFRALKVARIELEFRHRIALHSVAESQKELLLLASQIPTRQRALVDLLLAEGAEITTVAEAIAQFDALPQPIRIDKVDKLAERFSGLPERDQFKFFDQHADRIEAWSARRSQRKAS